MKIRFYLQMVVYGLIVAGLNGVCHGQGISSSTDQGISNPKEVAADSQSSGSEAVVSGDFSGSAGKCFSKACCMPRWEVSADYLIWERRGGKSQTLLQNAETNAEYLNVNDFHTGFDGGPRIDLLRHGDNGLDMELLYFGIDGWSDSKALLYREDGYAYHINGITYNDRGPMNIGFQSKLYNAECNLRWHPYSRITAIAGFRWANVTEAVDGLLIGQGDQGRIAMDNNLYGFQIGMDALLFERNRFSVNGILKAGGFDNRVTQVTEEEGAGSLFAATDHGAFIGEIGLQAKYQFTRTLSLRGGYQVLWLDGIATLPLNNTSAVAIGGTALYHGANVGLEWKF